MAFASLKFYSEALKMQCEISVIIPQKSAAGEIGVTSGVGGEGKYKCLYLLHGLSDDHTIWARRTSIERYAQEYGIVVVMPCAARSFYTNMKYGGAYYDYIAKEVPRIVREFFNVSDKREDNVIAGLSMGGYGALKIGMRECDSFCAAAGLSSVADIESFMKIDRFVDVAPPIFGEGGEIPASENLFDLATELKSKSNQPRLYMGVGKNDFLYADNQRLREHIESLGLDLTYREGEGIHSWIFWDEHIRYVLEWAFKK